MMKRIIILFLLSIVSIFAEIKTELSSYQIITGADGKVERLSAEEGTPGDILEYIFYVKNEDTTVIYNLNPVIPIPLGTTLLENKIAPKKDFKVSINGRDFVDYPIIKNNIEIPMIEYRAVSWSIPQLNVGAETNLSVQVKINLAN